MKNRPQTQTIKYLGEWHTYQHPDERVNTWLEDYGLSPDHIEADSLEVDEHYVNALGDKRTWPLASEQYASFPKPPTTAANELARAVLLLGDLPAEEFKKFTLVLAKSIQEG